jgi:transcriptional regulator with XRE-family HTH domain
MSQQHRQKGAMAQRSPYKTERAKNPGHFIREWRLHLGRSQEEVAEDVKLAVPQISRIERGTNGYRQETLELFAKAFNCTPADLLRPPQAPQDPLAAFVDHLDGDDRERALAILRAALPQ